MTAPSNHHDASLDLLAHNQAAWDQQAAQDCEWSRPVTPEIIAAARGGDLSAARLTPEPLPRGWLDAVRGLRILCLACAGGQQAPVLAAAGADVTVFDLSEGQLDQDRAVAREAGADCRARRYARPVGLRRSGLRRGVPPHLQPVRARRAARVARVLSRAAAGGRLLSSFYNPVVFVGDRDPRYAEQGLIRPAHALPYADTRHLTPRRWMPSARAARRWCSATRCRTRSAASSTPASCWRAFMKRASPAALRDRWLSADLPGHLGRQAGLSAPAGAAISPARAGRCCRARPARAPGAGCPDRHRPASATAVPGPAGPSDASANGWCSGR